MAKASKRSPLPARTRQDRSRDEEALLLRSAESLGRLIGALQREIDQAVLRLSGSGGGVTGRSRTSKTSADGDGRAARRPPSMRADGKTSADGDGPAMARRRKMAAGRKPTPQAARPKAAATRSKTARTKNAQRRS